MAINKPTKPDVTLPDSFGGVHTAYTDTQIQDGYEDGIPQVVDGGNMNYERDGLFQHNKYNRTVTDVLVDMPIGKVLTVDNNNRFEYSDQPKPDWNETNTTSLNFIQNKPNYDKQIEDLQTADTQNVKTTGDQTVGGTKTFTAHGTKIKSLDDDITVFPNNEDYNLIDFVDKNDSRYGVVGRVMKPDGFCGTYLQARNVGYIRVLADKNGTVKTSAPTPPVGDNSRQIATTEWINKNMLPNYSAGVTVSLATLQSGYTFPSNGIMMITMYPNAGTLTIGGQSFGTKYAVGVTATPAQYLGAKGTVIKYAGSVYDNFYKGIFYPFKRG